MRGLRLWAGAVGCALVPGLLPGYVSLAGLSLGADWGRRIGVLGGLLWTILGDSPWNVLFLGLLGELSGLVFHQRGRPWGKCLLLLTLWEGVRLLLHLGEGPLSILLSTAGRELLISILVLPLAFLLFRLLKGRSPR